MTYPRKDIVVPGVDGTYHCISRCVRRAFLCGFDSLSKKNYDHRKVWIRTRLQFLASIFAVDVLAFAVMSNHLHVMLRTCLAALNALSDREIAERWLMLYPKRNNDYGKPTEDDITLLAGNPQKIEKLRARLGDVSWFMKSLNEYVARKANKEDDCKGHFWEGRFKCKAIADEAAALSCAIYIDLNPIRGEIAKTPEESVFTSAWERITARDAGKELDKKDDLVEASNTKAAAGKKPVEDTWLAPISSFLSMDLDQYLALLDWTGRQVQHEKRGKIPDNLAPILERLKINPEHWIDNALYHGSWFYRFVGNIETMAAAAAAAGRNWFKGMQAASKLFSSVTAAAA